MDKSDLEKISKEIDALAEDPDSLKITIYTPSSEVWSENEKNQIKAKNLISIAKKQLKGSYRESYIKPMMELVDNKLFWKNLDKGILLIGLKGITKSYNLPIKVEPQLHLGTEIDFSPLQYSLENKNSFYLLVLSKNKVELYDCENTSFNLVSNENLPTNSAELLSTDDPEKSIQFRSTDRGTFKQTGVVDYHGHGQYKDGKALNKHRFIEKVARLVEDELSYDDQLVIASTDTNYALFNNMANLKAIVKGNIKGNPDNNNIDALVNEAFKLVAHKKE